VKDEKRKKKKEKRKKKKEKKMEQLSLLILASSTLKTFAISQMDSFKVSFFLFSSSSSFLSLRDFFSLYFFVWYVW